MKKRNFKQLFKVILEGFAYAIWLLLISISIVYVVDGHSAWLKATLIVISVAYTGALIAMVSKSVDKNEKQKAEDKNKKLQELKIQDKYYIDLVDSQVEKTLNKLKNELLNVEVDKSLDYLISFSNKVNWICNTNSNATKREGKFYSCRKLPSLFTSLTHHRKFRHFYGIFTCSC